LVAIFYGDLKRTSPSPIWVPASPGFSKELPNYKRLLTPITADAIADKKPWPTEHRKVRATRTVSSYPPARSFRYWTHEELRGDDRPWIFPDTL
jgi:hypothetical protein